jgi:hypothetical protein
MLSVRPRPRPCPRTLATFHQRPPDLPQPLTNALARFLKTLTPNAPLLPSQMALSTGSRLLLDSPLIYTAGQRGSVKAWPLVRTSDGSLRTVIINKHATDSARLAVSINRGSLGGGKLLRLRAPGGLFASGGVQIARVSYGWESTEVDGHKGRRQGPRLTHIGMLRGYWGARLGVLCCRRHGYRVAIDCAAREELCSPGGGCKDR